MSGTNNIMRAVLILLVTLVAAPAFADGIEVTTQVHKRLLMPSADGKPKERFVPAAKIVPGDIVAYTISARNGSTEPAERVVITDPVPEHMKYVEGSAAEGGARVLFSVDGGFRFDAAENLSVTTPDGESRPAAAGDYTHIRWVFADPIAPSAERAVRFFAQLQ